MKLFKSLYLTSWLFYCLIGLAALFVISFFLSPLLVVTRIFGFLLLAVCLWDIIYLFGVKDGITAHRDYPDRLSNGDNNDFKIQLTSHYPNPINIRIEEEIPFQLQVRDFEINRKLQPASPETVQYQLRPVQRGVYSFGLCNVFVRHLGLVERRFKVESPIDIPCYPSFLQLRKYTLMATTHRLDEIGVKRIRRIGSTMEFDSIKEYARGDEYRFINWKATAKTGKMMVNQYEDERSQPVYSFIDLSRSMRMPFEGLTLLDYAINSSLVLSSISIRKDDKAGLLTFSKLINTHLAADKRNHQMHLISEALYKVTTEFEEAEYGRLYAYAKRNISQRSLIFLYTNFETLNGLHRQLPYLRLLNKSHIVVTIIFKNTELQNLARQKADRSIDIYNQIVAEKFNYEKQLIVQELQAAGIQTIFTEPQNLTINAINKYLEVKARGLI